MALDSYLYLNPETVLQRKQEHAARQARACGFCIHHKSIVIKDETLHACAMNRCYGKRCDRYQTTTTRKKP